MKETTGTENFRIIETQRRYQCVHCGDFKRNVDMEVVINGRGMCYKCFDLGRWSRTRIRNLLTDGLSRHPGNYTSEILNRLPEILKKEAKEEYMEYQKRTSKSKYSYTDLKKYQPPKTGD